MDDSPLSSRIPRRHLMKLAAGGGAAAALAVLPGCSSKDDDDGESPTSGPTSSGATSTAGATATRTTTHPEPGPKVLQSTGGILKATLTVQPEMIAHGTGTRWALTVNGHTPGPTLRVKPGDSLRLTLDNQTGHSTNIHTHGLRVSPTGNADNPFLEIKHGEKFDYQIDIPADHPGGSFWYHPHFHHHVAEQLYAGFFGLIIVEDTVDRLPEIAGATERLLLLHDTTIGSNETAVMSANMMAQREGREGDVFVSGQQNATFEAAAGKLERWRILNASASRFYRLKLDGHPMFLMSTDADRLPAPLRVDEIALVPGERIEVLVQPAAAGSYALKSLSVGRGSMMQGSNIISNPEFTLATMKVAGAAPVPPLPAKLANTEDIRSMAQPKTREVVFSMQGQMGGATFLIDGKTFDPGRIDIRIPLDTVEDWIVRNTSPMDHPFHLHIWPFQLMEHSSGVVDGIQWKDTINVPANGWVRLRIRFSKIPGKTVFHCHILDHEDLGMMATIEVA